MAMEEEEWLQPELRGQAPKQLSIFKSNFVIIFGTDWQRLSPIGSLQTLVGQSAALIGRLLLILVRWAHAKLPWEVA
jgi:hypothetical protein